MITLYDLIRSGNCYKVRLLLWMLDLEFERYAVDFIEGKEHKSADFLAMNPLGQVPVLTDTDPDTGETITLRDSQAILTYIAKRYDTGKWLPETPAEAAHVAEWLSFSANEILNGLAITRAIISFGRPGDEAFHRAIGDKALTDMNTHLANLDWLVGKKPTIADLACYPYVALSPDGHFDPTQYRHVHAWMGRIEALPGHRSPTD